MHLQLAGYNVKELEDAACARDALREGKPALVLLDIMMPGEDGFSLGEDLIKAGIPVIFLTAREVWRNGIPVSMTTLEFNLMKALIDAGKTAMSREDLLTAVWGYHYTGETRTVDVHVQRLRGKIGNNRIETLVKFGYRFREDV